MATKSALSVRVGARVRALRSSLGLSQAALAEAVDLSPKHVGAIERGDTPPSLETIGAIADALKVDASELFAGEVKPESVSDAWLVQLLDVASRVPRFVRPLALDVLRTFTNARPLRGPRRRKTRHD